MKYFNHSDAYLVYWILVNSYVVIWYFKVKNVIHASGSQERTVLKRETCAFAYM